MTVKWCWMAFCQIGKKFTVAGLLKSDVKKLFHDSFHKTFRMQWDVMLGRSIVLMFDFDHECETLTETQCYTIRLCKIMTIH